MLGNWLLSSDFILVIYIYFFTLIIVIFAFRLHVLFLCNFTRFFPSFNVSVFLLM